VDVVYVPVSPIVVVNTVLTKTGVEVVVLAAGVFVLVYRKVVVCTL